MNLDASTLSCLRHYCRFAPSSYNSSFHNNDILAVQNVRKMYEAGGKRYVREERKRTIGRPNIDKYNPFSIWDSKLYIVKNEFHTKSIAQTKYQDSKSICPVQNLACSSDILCGHSDTILCFVLFTDLLIEYTIWTRILSDRKCAMLSRYKLWNSNKEESVKRQTVD